MKRLQYSRTYQIDQRVWAALLCAYVVVMAISVNTQAQEPMISPLPVNYVEVSPTPTPGLKYITPTQTPTEKPSNVQVATWIAQYDWDKVIAYKLAKSENAWNYTQSFDCTRTNKAGNTPPSTDRGLMMINDYWHPEVSDADAFDCEKNIEWSYKIYKARGNWSAWSAYLNGSYSKHTIDAEVMKILK